MTLNVAIVGLGNIGNIHAGVYQKNPAAKIVAVCDIIKERADKAAAVYGARRFYSVQAMLASGHQDRRGQHVHGRRQKTAVTITSRPWSCSRPASRFWGKSPSRTISARRRRWWPWPKPRTCATASISIIALPLPPNAPRNG